MVLPKGIQVIPGPRPGVFFNPALGLVLPEWYVTPFAPILSLDTTINIPVKALFNLFFVPYMLSFNRLAYNVNALPGGPGDRDIQFAVYEFNPAILRVQVSDVFNAIGTRAITTAQVLESGLYWLGIRGSFGLATDVKAWATAAVVPIIGSELPIGAFPYSGELVSNEFPVSFDPLDLNIVGGGTLVIPQVRFYAI